MLSGCACLGKSSKRRGSSTEDTSSCRSSDIERAGANMETTIITPKNIKQAILDAAPPGSAAAIAAASDNGVPPPSATARAANSLRQMLSSKNWYRHFRKPGRGMSMTKCEITIKAVLLIQAWYRRHLSRMEIRRRTTWTIFQRLELASEQDQFELYKFFNALLTHIPGAQGQQDESSKTSSDDQLSSRMDDDLEQFRHAELTKAFSTIEINFPLDKPEIDKMIELFRKHKKVLLHPKHVFNILKEAALRLQRLANFNTASTAISKQVTVCGDLHGNLDDLLVIFYKNGLPSSNNPYVFNGDFVDRGKRGLEVFLLLLSCFLAFPNAVFLNRGNHEDSVMNTRYGFTTEVEKKYGPNSTKLLKRIEEVYRWLPLGTIVNNRVLIVHGGISDATNLDLLKSLDRGKYISILRPPIGEGGERVDKNEWKQIFDIMWSDPQTPDGCIPNTLRGAGTYFGPDVTENFLKKYKLDFIIRSHECKPDGHEFCHDQKVITIFSASNYYAIGSNRGAYLKLNPRMQTQFFKYISEASKTRQMTFHQRVGIIESAALRELGVRLRAQRSVLEQEFLKHDAEKTGLIPIARWCESLEKATNLGLPWRLLREKLAPQPGEIEGSKAPKMVNYKTTLDMLDSEIIMEAYKLNTSVADSLYKNISSLETIFHILDKDNSGCISIDEFSEACDLLEKFLPGTSSKEEMLQTCQLMDLNKDGVVDLNEFLEAFRLCDQKRSGDFVGLLPNRDNLQSTLESAVKQHEESAAAAAAADSEITKQDTDEDDAVGDDEAFDPSDNDLRLRPGEVISKKIKK